MLTQVRRKLTTIKNHQLKWNNEETNLQNLCPHPDVSKTYRGDSGNWDRSDDCYWIEFNCPDCNKYWVEDQ